MEMDDIGAALGAYGLEHWQDPAPSRGLRGDGHAVRAQASRQLSLIGVGVHVVRQEEDLHERARSWLVTHVARATEASKPGLLLVHRAVAIGRGVWRRSRSRALPMLAASLPPEGGTVRAD